MWLLNPFKYLRGPLLGSTGEQCYGEMGTMEGYGEEEGPTLENGDDTDGQQEIQEENHRRPHVWVTGQQVGHPSLQGRVKQEGRSQVTFVKRGPGVPNENTEKWFGKVGRFL